MNKSLRIATAMSNLKAINPKIGDASNAFLQAADASSNTVFVGAT
ncbi:hypothetical protein [Pseudoxanthomonas sp. UTMC 1351]